ncbi:MAG: cation:proton antiporter [Proteobacteria bacterium]|nr:cation:proton antiporter [Pseudomonadota bacterium]
MHYLDESHILLFLLQLIVLLGVARTLAAICVQSGIPALAGEILAGVALGPTLFGRYAPGLQAQLFPQDAVQSTMLETVSWLGVFFLLLASGFHVDAGQALKSGKAAMLVGIVGVVVPIAMGAPIFALLDPALHGPSADGLSFALFVGVAGSITAISVVARALDDLGLAGTPEGTLALSACAINDLFGWLLFSVVMTVATAEVLVPVDLALTTFAAIGFVGVCILLGSRVIGLAALGVRKTSLSQPAAIQALVVGAGLVCGAATQWLGIHAILGFFIAGTMAGTAKGVSNEMRESLSDTMHAVFVPLFFATLGVKIDFFDGFEPTVVAVFTSVAMGGKFIGAWLGARLGGVPPRQAVFLGLVFTPGGAMEIVVATLALELRLIGQPVFVAIVFAALLSSITAGPLMGLHARRLALTGKT